MAFHDSVLLDAFNGSLPFEPEHTIIRETATSPGDGFTNHFWLLGTANGKYALVHAVKINPNGEFVNVDYCVSADVMRAIAFVRLGELNCTEFSRDAGRLRLFFNQISQDFVTQWRVHELRRNNK